MSYSPAFSQAIEILIFIEMKSQKEYYKYCSIPKISEELKVPVPSVKRLIGMLKKAGFIRSKAGIKGGLALAQSLKDISLYDIFLAIEGQEPLFRIYEGFDIESFVDKKEVIPILEKSKQILANIEKEMINELSSQHLSDLFVKED